MILEVLPVFSNEVNQISRWVQGLGLLAVMWVAYSTAIFLINRKNAKNLEKIKRDLNEVNRKLDKLIKKK